MCVFPRTGHDKCGVEAHGKGTQWQELVPIPSGPDLQTISKALMERLDARCGDGRDEQGRTIGDRFVDELAQMLPLPANRFRAASFHHVSVTRRSLVTIKGAGYSVWSDRIKLPVKAYVGVEGIEITGPGGWTVAHPRVASGARSIDYRHYCRGDQVTRG